MQKGQPDSGTWKTKSGLFLRARADQLLSKAKATEWISDRPELANYVVDSARARLSGSGRMGPTDIRGREVKELERERKLASVYSEDHICAFPGYAALQETEHGGEVVLQMSGYAYRTRPLERASRSQKVFVAAARQLAGLARLPDRSAAGSEEDLSDAGGLINDNVRKQDAFTQLLALGEEAKKMDDTEVEAETNLLTEEPDPLPDSRSLPPRAASSSSEAGGNTKSRQASMASFASGKTGQTIDSSTELGRMHINLQDRLRAFFSQKLEQRHVRVIVRQADALHAEPLARGNLLTGEGGAFAQLIHFPASRVKEGDLLEVNVELLPDPNLDAPSVEGEHQRDDSCIVSISPRRAVHIVSDLDDTCKHTQVLAGARKVIRNTFALDLGDLKVPGMSDWYNAMQQEGAHFHYVSNSPYELAAVVRRFLVETDMPSGQLVLKQYARGSGLVTSLWEPAGQRKRGNVEAVLKAFPDSPFICIGDSGEQDLELYCSLAKQYPDRIKAIFIRDVTTAFAQASIKPNAKTQRAPRRATTDPALFASEGMSKLSIDLVDDSQDALSPNNPLRESRDAGISEQHRKLMESLFQRIATAERELPPGILLRIFTSGDECRQEGKDLVRSLAV